MSERAKVIKARDLRQVHKVRTVFLAHYNLPAVELMTYRKSSPYIELTVWVGGARRSLSVMPDYEIMVVL